MQLNFVNPVLNSCNAVLTSVAGLHLQVGKPHKKKPEAPVVGKCVTGLIGMEGKLRRASMAIIFSDTVLVNIASKMLPDGGVRGAGVSIDLVGEISNMILGRAKGELEEQGYDFQMSLPTMMVGYDYIVPHQTKGVILRIPYASSGGPFYVEVCFDGAPVSDKEAKAAALRKAAQDLDSSHDVELF